MSIITLTASLSQTFISGFRRYLKGQVFTNVIIFDRYVTGLARHDCVISGINIRGIAGSNYIHDTDGGVLLRFTMIQLGLSTFCVFFF